MPYDFDLLIEGFEKRFRNVNHMREKTGLHPDLINNILTRNPSVQEASVRRFAEAVGARWEEVEHLPPPVVRSYPITLWPIETMDFRPRLDPRNPNNQGRGRDLYIIVSWIHLTLLDDDGEATVSNFRLTCKDLETLNGIEFRGARWASLSEENNEKNNPMVEVRGKPMGYWLATTNPKWSESGPVVSTVHLNKDRTHIKFEMGFSGSSDKYGNSAIFDDLVNELMSPDAPNQISFSLTVDYVARNIDHRLHGSYIMATRSIGVQLNAFIKDQNTLPNRFKLLVVR